ncbi:hypothetical protein GOP47_0012334 [Adiantum capillus-veneris]|uniref:Uncharacterized protein n=1 Tax=Adiantum capillus-veneris TaxID=13818 RepID=A0A9D4URV0_ADICA|nr:hypothetical protein GOP47_0012334 [Adiantum capillus-veneris]
MLGGPYGELRGHATGWRGHATGALGRAHAKLRGGGRPPRRRGLALRELEEDAVLEQRERPSSSEGSRSIWSFNAGPNKHNLSELLTSMITCHGIHSQQFQASKRLKVTSKQKTSGQPQLGSSSEGHSDFEITEVNPVSTRDLMIDAMQTRGLTFGRAYTEVMESFFGSEKTSSSDYMEEDGEEEEDSSSSSDEEVQRDMPPSTVMQTPATSNKQRKKSVIEQHVHNLKFKMKNKPNAIVLPLLVLVDRQQCPTKNSWVKANAESYTYWVLGGTHSLIVKQELAAEYEHVDTYKMAMCWVYAGLTDEEAKVLALDHNIDSDFCLEMSFIQKIRFFHNEWVDTIKHGGKVDDNFRVALCEKCGLEVKNKGGRGASQKLNTKQYDNYFQLAFRDGEVWDLQEEIFKLHEQGKLKGQKLSKSHESFKGKGVSKEIHQSPSPKI